MRQGWSAQNQTDKSPPDEIRRQLERVQLALERLENSGQKNDRVTEIGSPRMPLREVGLVVRLYDVSDLFAVAPSYEAYRLNDLQPNAVPMFPSLHSETQTSGGGFGGMGGGGGMFRVSGYATPKTVETPPILAAVQGTRTSIDELISAITTTIAPTTWSEAGGEGSIAKLGRALLISTEVKSHEQIEALLALFRQRWKTLRTVTVRSQWLWLTDEQLAAPVPATNPEQPGLAVADEKAWENRPQKDERLGSGYRSVITCYNGQTVNTVSGGQSLLVTSFQATGAANADPKQAATVNFIPAITSVQDGVALQVTPLVSSSGKYVVLDVHSRVTKVFPAAEDKPAAAKVDNRGLTPQEVVGVINHSTVSSQRLSTTLRVPLNRNVLVGGMTFDAEPGQAPEFVPVHECVRSRAIGRYDVGDCRAEELAKGLNP